MEGYIVFMDARTLYIAFIKLSILKFINLMKSESTTHVFLVYVYLHTQNKYLVYLEFRCVSSLLNKI